MSTRTLTTSEACERLTWLAKHPEVWQGGQPLNPFTRHTLADVVVMWPDGVEPTPADVHHHDGEMCRRAATVTVDNVVIRHRYPDQEVGDCDRVCTCGHPLDNPTGPKCNRCEHGDDDTTEES